MHARLNVWNVALAAALVAYVVPFRAVLYGTDDSLGGRREPARADGVDYVLLPVNLDADVRADWRSVSAAFERVSSNDAWVLYRRDPRIPLPPARSPAG